jgi:hypothetical protein
MFSVEHTREFDRVADLPRRKLSIDEAWEWSMELTPLYALRPGASLRPWQAMSLAEAVRCGGAWLALPVGQGKTLCSFLLPSALQSTRTLLILPASLLEKTYADFRSYHGVWRSPPCPLRIESREKIATVGGADILTEYAPDLIIIDESDDLSNARSSTARRIDRYVKVSPSTRIVAMTGTPARKSLLGYWHLLCWCLGQNAPVPMGHDEARNWALALDDHKGIRPSPGPLGATLQAARAWYRRRLTETPGVVVVDEDSCDAPLTVRVRLSREDAELDAAFERFLVEQESPGGIPVSDPLSRWLLGGQLGLGLYTRWNPAPPEPWRSARRAVAKFVRERIDASTRTAQPLDTEAQVLRRYESHHVVSEWQRLKPTFDGSTETVWITRSTLDACHDWLRDLQGQPGIVWCGSVEFGRAFAKEAGLAYYGPRGQTDDGKGLHDAPPEVSLVSSWGANKKGFNLQAWRRQLIVMPPQSAKWLEQIFGRSHRAGQAEPVIVDVLATSGGTMDAFEAAISEAQCVRDNVALTQKLLRANLVRTDPRVTPGNEFRWARQSA